MRPKHIKLLTPAERAGCMKMGAILKLAERGIRPADLTKEGQGVLEGIGTTMSGVAKTVALVSLLAGVPMGTAAYMVGKRISATRSKERELKQQTQFYQDASGDMERGLAASGATV